MSKQRPSSLAGRRGVQIAVAGDASIKSAQWASRLFRNSYTRGGRCFVLDGWTVKIQHQGHRRTFSLWGKTREAAALEAKAIHDTILTEGWEAALRNHPPRTKAEERFPKTDERYWRQRLILRRYCFPGSGANEQDLAARIDHMGIGYFFPLGSSDPQTAAAKAKEIYESIVEEGWNAACRKFSRELIIGLEWSSNPILWTYTTVHTLMNGVACGPGGVNGRPGRRVLIAENDACVRGAILWCINQQPGYCARGCELNDSLKQLVEEYKPDLLLLNRNLAARAGLESPGQLTVIAPALPALTYSTYADGDQMFVSTPGGSDGYMLKRLKPDRLFEPILDAAEFSVDHLLSRIKSYFKALLQPRADSDASGLARLTQREREVLSLLSKGCVDKEIALALGISAWTVHGHIKKIFERLRVRTRTEAVVRYLEK